MNDQQRLINAIKRARGSRSIRQYADDAQVNAATISRIERGEYIPSRNLLKKLTSINAKPQNGVTIKELEDLAENARMFELGKNIGIGAAELILSSLLPMVAIGKSILSTPKDEKKRNEQEKKESSSNANKSAYERLIEEHNQKQKRFQAMSIGLIYQALAEKEVLFQPIKGDGDNEYKASGVRLIINQSCISEWWFEFDIEDEEVYEYTDLPADFRATIHMARFVRYDSDPHRKISLVTSDYKLYEEMIGLEGHNSYRGNLSVIYIDEQNLKIKSENNIAYYNLDENETINLL